MVTRRRVECNTPEKECFFLGGVFGIGLLTFSVLCAIVRVYSVRMEHEGKRREGGRLVGLQFLFGAAAEVVPVEGAPKVVAVL